MKRDSVLSLISIARKAGRISAGEFQTEDAVKSGKACLVMIAQDASENTKKKFRNMCDFYEVPSYCYGTKVQLGSAIGCEFRAVLAVTEPGLSGSIVKQMESRKDGGNEHGENQGT